MRMLHHDWGGNPAREQQLDRTTGAVYEAAADPSAPELLQSCRGGQDVLSARLMALSKLSHPLGFTLSGF